MGIAGIVASIVRDLAGLIAAVRFLYRVSATTGRFLYPVSALVIGHCLVAPRPHVQHVHADRSALSMTGWIVAGLLRLVL